MGNFLTTLQSIINTCMQRGGDDDAPTNAKVSINCSCFHSNNYVDENDGVGTDDKEKDVLRCE
jgi:hypothetical protein